MTAPWHSSLRSVHGLHQRGGSEWDRCPEDGCTGIALPEASGACWQHADDRGRAAATERMREQRHFDLRGTVLGPDLLESHRFLLADRRRDGRDLGRWLEVGYDFQSCRFTAPVDFHDVGFPPGHVDFTNAVFESSADFGGAFFTGPVFFDRTRFAETVSFEQTQFDRDAWFLQTDLGHSATFADTVFSGFGGFHKVTARSELSFVGASFAGRAHIEEMTAAAVDFTDAVFTQRAVVDLSGTAAVFDGARFEAGIELRLLGENSSASLRRVHFGASSTISGSSSVSVSDTTDADDSDDPAEDPAADGRFTTVTSLSYSWTSDLPGRVLSVQDTDVEKLSLVNVDLSRCLFAGAQNLDKLRLAGAITFAQLPRGGFRTRWNWPVVWRWSRRDVIREEYLWRAQLAGFGVSQVLALRTAADLDTRQMFRDLHRRQRQSEAGQYWLREFATAPNGPRTERSTQLITGEHLASLYRSLRKAREDAKDEPGAGDFYYGEMEARRRGRGTRRAERWLLTAYWAISGYGQRAGRALAALAVLMAVLSALLLTFGLPDTAATQHMTGTVASTSPGTTQQIDLDVSTPPLVLPSAGQRWTADRAGRAVRIVVGSVVLRDTDQRLTTAGVWTLMAGRALGPVLLALAALAIRARVKR